MKKSLNVIGLMILMTQISYSQLVYFNNESIECQPKVFHVSVHIVLDEKGRGNISRNEIERHLDVATSFYDPICWSFENCKLDTIINHAYNSLNLERYEKLQEYFNDDHMVNLYYVSEGHTADFCGIADVDGILDPTTASVVMAKDCSGIDLVHKLGHMFGLPDTFSGTEELVDGSNCNTTGDRFCSTPADPYVINSIESFSLNCEFVFEGKDRNDQYYNPMIGNVMSHYFGCRDGLTVEQYRAILAIYEQLTYTPW